MTNSERFLEAFAQIERYLKESAPHQRHRSFYQLVELAGETQPAVKQVEHDIKEYADLRNAIIHERRGGMVIAEPNSYVVEDIERIVELVRAPPTLIPLFETNVAELSESTEIAMALEIIYNKSISQIPIRRGRAIVDLLSTSTIVRWLGASTGDELVDLLTVPISEVLRYSEDRENHAFLRGTATVFEMLDLFHVYEHQGKRLDAILITERGRDDESILGIVTISDLPKALHAVSRPDDRS